jgi:hypothetical protein
MTAAGQAVGRTRAEVLFRRQLWLSMATLVLVMAALAFLRWHVAQPAVIHYTPAPSGVGLDMRPLRYGPSPAMLRVAVAELVLCGVVAVFALGHAARVIAFVFSKEEVS